MKDETCQHNHIVQKACQWIGGLLLLVAICFPANAAFETALFVPSAATLISPVDTTCDPTPSYRWYKVSNAAWYRLYVRDSGGTVHINKWYSSSQAGCGSNTCLLTLSVALPANKTYYWWVQTYNSYGASPWSSPKAFKLLAGFNSQFNGNTAGWNAVAGPWWVNSMYLLTTGVNLQWASVRYSLTSYKDLNYAAKLLRIGSDSNTNGIIVRGTPVPLTNTCEWDDGYYFQYSRYGTYSVWRLLNGNAYALQFWTYSSAINQGNVWNLLRVYARGSSFWFGINGTWVWNGSDTSFSSGSVGITMYDDGTSTNKLYVDWATLFVVNNAYDAMVEHREMNAEQQELNAAAEQWSVGTIHESPGFVVIRKAGEGEGTITLGEYICDQKCSLMAVPYIEGARYAPQVTTADGSSVESWKSADGQTISSQVFHAQPGEELVITFTK